jgi:hypothetical protein
VVTLQRSKTDQEGQGRKIGIPYASDPLTCPGVGLNASGNGAQCEAGVGRRSLMRSPTERSSSMPLTTSTIRCRMSGSRHPAARLIP